RLFNAPLMARPDTARVFGEAFDRIAGGEMPVPGMRVSQVDKASRGQYAVADGGIAILTIEGPLVQRAGQINPDCSPIASDQGINARLRAMAEDPAVKGIVLEFDSPGGEVANVFELGARITELSKSKPVYASANEGAFSAAYALAAAAEVLTVPATGMV